MPYHFLYNKLLEVRADQNLLQGNRTHENEVNQKLRNLWITPKCMDLWCVCIRYKRIESDLTKSFLEKTRTLWFYRENQTTIDFNTFHDSEFS